MPEEAGSESLLLPSRERDLKAPILFEQRLFYAEIFKNFKHGGGEEEKTKAKRFN